MDCQIGSRRCATWDEIEEAPQIKRLREDKSQGDCNLQTVNEQPAATQQQPASVPAQKSTAVTSAEQPKFYISSPIQGFTVTKEGGCRYLFF